jgi:GDP-L-fucose synthase
MVKKKLFIAGHQGMLGNAIYKSIKRRNIRILLATRKQLDLENFNQVNMWFKKNRPNYVIIAAAKAGGILDNSKYPVDYMLVNIKIQTNIISLSHKYNVEKLIFIGSSCIYPKFSKNPIKEEELLTGSLEPTNQWYALSKIHGVKLCEAYRRQYKRNYSCVMPTNLYGPNDKYSDSAHVIPALIKRIHEAKINKKKYIEVWGDGSPKREFMYVEDCAKVICKILFSNKYYPIINIGTRNEVTIKYLAEKISKIIRYKGKIKFDTKKPNGTMRKLLDISKIKNIKNITFTDFDTGLKITYEDFIRRFY